ncbi:MAG: hypothetical protein JWO48_2533 [Bryobacterales bacterium]|nr:hypothetical protein [Bryobacterales bacterium]
MLIRRVRIFLFMVLLASCSVSAVADTLSDSLTVYAPDGSVFAAIGVAELVEDANQIYFIDIPDLVDTSQFGNATALLEPGTGTFSDVFGVASTQGSLFLGFTSDTETVPAAFGGAAGIELLEDRPQFDATMYLARQLRDAGYTATFVSDISEVPEPSSVALLVAGLLGYVALRRRRISSASATKASGKT